jgi:hypothetical protein
MSAERRLGCGGFQWLMALAVPAPAWLLVKVPDGGGAAVSGCDLVSAELLAGDLVDQVDVLAWLPAGSRPVTWMILMAPTCQGVATAATM